MGWHINEVKNEVVINEKIAKQLVACDVACDFGWESSSDVMYDNKLLFNSDHMEHMDFLEYKEIQEILKKHKVKGDVCFSSEDGDNAGSAWGYRFDGKGGMVLLQAVRVWEPVEEKHKKGKRK